MNNEEKFHKDYSINGYMVTATFTSRTNMLKFLSKYKLPQAAYTYNKEDCVFELSYAIEHKPDEKVYA